jgi:dTMP kinase
MKKDGFVISFEGIDYSGKSTQIELLKKYLKGIGREVTSYVCLNGTEPVDLMGKIVLSKDIEKIDPITELLLYQAARRELIVKKVKPDLKEGKIVILDRYIDSTFVYQGMMREINIEYIDYLNNMVIDNIVPAITFLIEITKEEYILRIKDASINDLDKIEIEIMNSYDIIHNSYKVLSHFYNRIIPIINDEIDVMAEKIRSHLKFLE